MVCVLATAASSEVGSCNRAETICYLRLYKFCTPSPGRETEARKRPPVKAPQRRPHVIMASMRVWGTSSYFPPTRGPPQITPQGVRTAPKPANPFCRDHTVSCYIQTSSNTPNLGAGLQISGKQAGEKHQRQ